MIGLLRDVRVALMGTVCARLGISRITVLRALSKQGYYSSYNFNSSYFTLEETPRFDAEGLWFYGQVGFSRHGTLARTIRALVERSPNGSMACELVEHLRTRVHNQLSGLVRTGQLGRFFVGHRAVYVSGAPQRAASQRACRESEVEGTRQVAREAEGGAAAVPQGLDVSTVIQVLVRWVETPDASVASVSRTLQARGVGIDSEGVRTVMAFYGLEKKTERSRRRC